jgi:hypothetical protein
MLESIAGAVLERGERLAARLSPLDDGNGMVAKQPLYEALLDIGLTQREVELVLTIISGMSAGLQAFCYEEVFRQFSEEPERAQ